MNYFVLGPEGWSCQHPDHNSMPLQTYWCGHLRSFLQSGEDARELGPNMRIVVPVFPDAAVFAQVHIGNEFVTGGAAPMELRHTPDIGRERIVELGFWNPGEGMMSIRTVILDYIRSQLDPREKMGDANEPVYTSCPIRSHPLAHNAVMARKLSPNDPNCWNYRSELYWNLVMERACTECLSDAQGGSSNNFGVDPDSTRVGRNPFNA